MAVRLAGARKGIVQRSADVKQSCPALYYNTLHCALMLHYRKFTKVYHGIDPSGPHQRPEHCGIEEEDRKTPEKAQLNAGCSTPGRAQEQRRRRTWVRPWLQRRAFLGQYDTLMNELRLEDRRGGYKSFLRMESDVFLQILVRVEARIRKKNTQRAPLLPGLKLAITLRFLATGISYRGLEFYFRVAHNTISLFVPEVCEVALVGQIVEVGPRFEEAAQHFLDVHLLPFAARLLL